MSQRLHDTPTVATAEQGEVMLDGPNGIALSMTPAAAMKSADQIRAAAAEAEKQRTDAARNDAAPSGRPGS